VQRNFEREPAKPITIPTVGTLPAVGPLISEEDVTRGSSWRMPRGVKTAVTSVTVLINGRGNWQVRNDSL
jgi:hypothetical protein